jgi:hypothetical protein
MSPALLPYGALAQEGTVDCSKLMTAELEAQSRAVVEGLIQRNIDAAQAEQWLRVLIPRQCEDTPENVSSGVAADRVLWRAKQAVGGDLDAR